MRPPKIVPLLVVLVLKRHVVKGFTYTYTEVHLKRATHNIHKGEGWGEGGGALSQSMDTDQVLNESHI